MKTATALSSQDARSYYDRIVHVAVFLVLRRLGILKPMITSIMLYTIQKMEHTIRTSFGDSVATYGGIGWRKAPHVTIQGNGASSLIWAAVSTVLFLALRRNDYGGIFHSHITQMLIQMVGFAYVDDTDLLQTKRLDSDTIEDIREELQGSLDVWQGTL